MTRTRPRLSSPRRIAVIGAGIAGLAAARTLQRSGHDVQVFEAAPVPGGRVATQDSPFGGFDSGAQYFTVRDARFAKALEATAADIVRRWSANAVRVLDEHGRVVEAALPAREAHWVAVPAMARLPERWAAPLAAAGALHLATRVTHIAPADEHGRIIGCPAVAPGVIHYPLRDWGLCGSITGAMPW